MLLFDHDIGKSGPNYEVSECKEYCQELDGCWSFDYDNNHNLCYYNNVTQSEIPLKGHPTADYYGMKCEQGTVYIVYNFTVYVTYLCAL